MGSENKNEQENKSDSELTYSFYRKFTAEKT